MRNCRKYGKAMLAGLLLLWMAPAHAAGKPTIFDSTLTISLLALMILLLIVIGILAYILLAAADIKRTKDKEGKTKTAAAAILLSLLLGGSASHAQETATATTAAVGDMPASTFYVMMSVIFLELVIILGLLINIRFLIRKEKQKLVTEELPAEQVAEIKKNKLNWWDKLNRFKPASQETELDTGHEYDGIRELNNRLPPWWLYGFYVTIIFAVVYLWRFHVSHDGPSSEEEYKRSVAKAEIDIKNYLEAKGESVDENTVTLLTSADDLAAGKTIFVNSCAACHRADGGGEVGPNLTDDYWMHGNDIKDVFKVIRYGINAMPQWQNSYSNKQIAQVASYVKSLHGTNPPNGKEPQGTEVKEVKEDQKPVTDSAGIVANH